MTAHNPNSAAEPFERFAAACALRMRAEPLFHAPYDIFEAPEEADDAYLVTLTGSAQSDAQGVRLVFLMPTAAGVGPSVRDVLWWLAGEAWTMEHAGHDLASWAADHDLDAHAQATTRRFEQRRQLTEAVRALLGDEDFARLLRLYGEQVVRPDPAAPPGTGPVVRPSSSRDARRHAPPGTEPPKGG